MSSVPALRMANSISLASTLLLGILTVPTGTLAQSTLPSVDTQNAIRELTIQKPSVNDRTNFREYKIDVEKLPPLAKERLNMDNQGNATTPLMVPNTLILQFQPNASKESIETLLKKHGLTVVEAFPNLGAVKVEGNLSRYFAPLLSDRNANDTLLRGANNLIADFRTEPIIRSVTPDMVLRAKSEGADARNLMKAMDIGRLVNAEGTETVDWGISNIEADKLWTMPGAQDGALFGVMDVGFARHEDIIFLEPANAETEDHGNHVAAIACGRHGNGKGIKGVIPNCFVRARTGNVFFRSAGTNPMLDFLVIFSQVLASLDRFLGQYDDVKVINLSMGYNWRSNFGVN